MSVETTVSTALMSDASFIGYVSAAALIDGVERNTIPLCDLDLERSTFDRLPSPLLWDITADTRIQLIEEQLEDPQRRILVAQQNTFIVGSVGVRFSEELPHRANIYGLTVLPSEKGTNVAYDLMKSAILTIRARNGATPVTEVRTGRYDLSERRNPIGRMLARSVNDVQPGAIYTEPFVWKGETGLYYHLAVDLFEELLDEFGPKLGRFVG